MVSPPYPRQLTEAGFERILERILNRAEQGASKQEIQQELTIQRVTQAELINWIKRSGSQVDKDLQRKRRLIHLGQQMGGKLEELIQDQIQATDDPVLTNHHQDLPVLESPTHYSPSKADPRTLDGNDMEENPSSTAENVPELVLIKPSISSRNVTINKESLIHKTGSSANQEKSDPCLAYQILADKLFRMNRFQDAIDCYDRSLQYKPDNFICWFNRGLAFRKIDQLQIAIQSYDQALKYQPEDWITWSVKGNTLYDLGYPREEIQSYDRALQYHPDDIITRKNRDAVAATASDR